MHEVDAVAQQQAHGVGGILTGLHGPRGALAQALDRFQALRWPQPSPLPVARELLVDARGDLLVGGLGEEGVGSEHRGQGLLARGDLESYLELMLPCEKLSRWVFRHPTRFYKADLAFLSWLNGHQENPCLVLHEERRRKRIDFLRTAELAAAARVLTNAELAADRIDELRHGV